MELSLSEHKKTLNELAELVRDEMDCTSALYSTRDLDLSSGELRQALALTNREFMVLVLGSFGSGKGNLINAFLGEELPLSILPITYPAEIRYGESRRMMLYPIQDQWKCGNSPVELSLGTCSVDVWLEENMPPRGKFFDVLSPVEKLVIYLPLDILKTGLVLIDMSVGAQPSFGDRCFREYFENANAIIYTMNSTCPITNDDIRRLEIINSFGFRNIITVCTNYDLVTSQIRKPEELQRFKNFISSHVENCTDLGSDSIHYLSSHEVLHAKQTGDMEALIESGFKRFEDFLEKNLIEGPGAYIVQNISSVIMRWAYRMIQDSGHDNSIPSQKRDALVDRLRSILKRAKEICVDYGIQDNVMIPEAIKTLKEIIALLPSEKRGEFLSPLQAIEDRFSDPCFYLSVIGNFSSGKSTFLNALLGMDLLSVDDLPTTAIPTFIRWERSKILEERCVSSQDAAGTNNPCIKVTLANGTAYYLDDFPGNNAECFTKETGISLPEEIGSRIDFITTCNSLASKIQRVDLFFPEKREFRNFCLIDTPGINPGDNAKHILNTQSILRETSDCAIILYPGMNTMTANTKKFIEDNAVHLLGNAVVLLTKMDLIPRKEWDKICKYTEKILREQFHQEQPLVYPISAWLAQEFQSGRNTTPEAQGFAGSFLSTSKQIMEILQTKRIEIVSRRLLQLLNDLAASMEKVMVNYRNTQVEQSELLRSHSWENVQNDVSIIHGKFKQRIKNQNQFYKSKIEQIVSLHIQSACENVCTAINASTNRSQLNDACGSFYQDQMRDAQSAAIKQIQTDVFHDIETKFKLPFVNDVTNLLKQHEYYLGTLRSGSLKMIDRGNLTVNISAGDNRVSFLDGNIVTIIGLAWGPVGFILGRAIDRIRLEFQKDSAKEAVRGNCTQMETDLKKNLINRFNRFKEGIYNWSEHILDSYQKEYRDLYDQASRSYLEKEREINRKLAQYTRAVENLGTLRKTIDV